MRKWYKYTINFNDALQSIDKKEDGEYIIEEKYKNNPRFKFYDEYLRKRIEKEKKILSIGSGECINELILLRDGYNITCSDVRKPLIEKIKKRFSQIEFSEYDVAEGPFNEKFDLIVSFSTFFNFDKSTFLNALNNISLSLNKGGRLIIDVGGAADNFLTRFIDGLCKYEILVFYFVLKVLQRRDCSIVRRQNGYRITDTEVIKFVQRSGFILRGLEYYDTFTEIGKRSRILYKLNKKSLFFQRLSIFLGRYIPYVRMFEFEKG